MGPTRSHPGLGGTGGSIRAAPAPWGDPQQGHKWPEQDRTEGCRALHRHVSVRGHGAASTGQREVGPDRPCRGNTLTNEGFSTPSSPPRSEAAGACWAPSPAAFVPDLRKVSANGDVTAAFGVPLTQPHTPGAPGTLVPLQSCECCCPVGASPAPGALLHPNASGTDVCCPPLATLSGHGCPLCCLGGDITHTQSAGKGTAAPGCRDSRIPGFAARMAAQRPPPPGKCGKQGQGMCSSHPAARTEGSSLSPRCSHLCRQTRHLQQGLFYP